MLCVIELVNLSRLLFKVSANLFLQIAMFCMNISGLALELVLNAIMKHNR